MNFNKKHMFLFILLFVALLVFATGTCSATQLNTNKKYWSTKNPSVYTYDNGWTYQKTQNDYITMHGKRYPYGRYVYYTKKVTNTYYSKEYHTTKINGKTRNYYLKVAYVYKSTWTKKVYYNCNNWLTRRTITVNINNHYRTKYSKRYYY